MMARRDVKQTYAPPVRRQSNLDPAKIQPHSYTGDPAAGQGFKPATGYNKNSPVKTTDLISQFATPASPYGAANQIDPVEKARLEGRLGYQQGLQQTGDVAAQNALGMYQQAALGQGPSAAQAMMAAQTDRNIQAQMALAAQGRGGNIGAMQRQASSVGAAQQQQALQQIAQIRAQEQMAGMAGYADLSNAIAGRGLQGTGLYENTLQGAYLGSMQAQTARQASVLDAWAREQESLRQYKAALRGQTLQFAGAGMDMVGSIGGGLTQGFTSDKRLKKDIKKSNIGETLGSLQPYQYRYKDDRPGTFGKGQSVAGIMAQDLEKTPLGKAIVHDTPQGKQVDIRGATSLTLAGLAELNKRLSKLEKGKAA